MNELLQAKALWNARFAVPDYVFGEAPNAFLLAQAARLGQGRALALADGEGRNSVWLAQQGFTVDAFDLSEAAVAKAQALAEKHQVSVNLSCTDWRSFDWRSAHYDLIVGIFFQFAEPQERTELFEHVKQSLKPGGVLVIQGYGKDQLRFNTGGPGKLANLYDEDTLRQGFAGFEVLVCHSYEADLHEGAAHVGRSALVGFVGRKP